MIALTVAERNLPLLQFLAALSIKLQAAITRSTDIIPKVILVTTGLLILLPAIFFFFADFSALPIRQRLLASFFQAVTPRTAGFNTVNLSAMSSASYGMMILLMLIGGSPGS